MGYCVISPGLIGLAMGDLGIVEGIRLGFALVVARKEGELLRWGGSGWIHSLLLHLLRLGVSVEVEHWVGHSRSSPAARHE